MTAPCPVAPEWAVEAWRAIITRHNATKAITTGDADQAAAAKLARLCVSREEYEEVLRDLTHRPCETKGPEDYEPGCCGPCRARAALNPKEAGDAYD